MNDFTASNGIRVVNLGGKWDQSLFQFAGEIPGLADEICQVREVVFQDPDVIALREFFQAESDERLGRWRSAVDPDFVVYEPREGQPARVLRESTAQPLDCRRSETRSTHPSAFESVARAYFDAHPEPKPWHDAKPGEVWVIVTRNVGDERAVQVYGEMFVYNDGISYPLTYEAIESALRIWPEVSA